MPIKRYARSVLQHSRAINNLLRRTLLYPARRFLTLQHFTGLILLSSAIALVTRPGVAMTALAAVLQMPSFPTLVGLLFLFCAALLLGRPVSEMRYRLLTLPLFLYFWAVVYYLITHPGTSWTGAIYVLAVWGFLSIARTELPPE